MRRRALAIAATATVGLVDAVYLTWDHLSALLDPAHAGPLCGARSSCDISRFGPGSELPLGSSLPGLPTSLIAAAFYLALVALALWAWRRDEPRKTAVIRVAALSSVLASATLIVVSLAVQGSLCGLCSVLYGVSAALAALAFWPASRSQAAAATPWLAGVRSWVSAGFVLVFGLALTGGFIVYAKALGGGAVTRILATSPVALDVAGRTSHGPPDAPIHVVEVADLQCPYCAELSSTLAAVQRDYPDLVRITFVHSPLDASCNPLVPAPMHPDACWLASVAVCADEQGRFFDVAESLFEHRAEHARTALLERLAPQWDRHALEACLASPRPGAAIAEDLSLVKSLGIKATPTFFINGYRIEGARPRGVIDALIARLSATAR